MTIHSAPKRRWRGIAHSATLALILLTARPAHAEVDLFLPKEVSEAWHICMGYSRDSGEPPPTGGQRARACFVIKQYFHTLGSPAKSLAGYGSLTIIPDTPNSDDCFDSSGVAIDPSQQFVYFSGGIGSPGRVCGFRRDPVTAAFVPIYTGTPPAVASNPRGVAIDPSARFLYVAGGPSGNVSGFSIDRTSGELTALPGSPYATNGMLPAPVVIDRAGRFMYVGQGVGSFDGSIAVLAIDPTTGALTHVPGSPFPTVASGRAIVALALTPDGRFLFTGGTLGTYAVNATTGALTRIAVHAAGSSYYGMAVDPTGRFLFAADDLTRSLKTFSIAANGTLTGVGPPQPLGERSWNVLSVSDLVYVASTATGSIYGFRINPASGALVPVVGSPFAAGAKPTMLAGLGLLPGAIQVDTGDNVVGSVGGYGGAPPFTWSIAGGALPTGLTLDAKTGVISGTAAVPGNYAFTAMLADNAGATATANKSIAVVGAAVPVPVIEFYNAALDHYFITYVADEIAKLDNGTFKGWARTGLAFTAFAATQGTTTAVCRIYIPPGKGDGHFFGRDSNECDGTMNRNPSFVLESSAFLHLFPATLGVCASGQVPVYRVFSNRADANHRYTTSRAVRDQMVSKGWLAEGDGPDTVVMCAPS